MNSDDVIRILRSGSKEAIENTLRFLAKDGLGGSLPDEVVRELLPHADKGLVEQDLLREVLLRYPSPRSIGSFMVALSAATVPDAEHALYAMGLWLPICSADQREQIRAVLERQTCSEHPIISFLACVKGIRHLGFNESHWQQAAKAITAADDGEWWQTIRSEVEEILEPAETKRVNLILKGMGRKPLEP